VTDKSKRGEAPGSIIHNMARHSVSGSLKRSIMTLFHTKKPNITIKNHPESYYKHVYIEQSLFDGIDFLATLKPVSKKKMTHDLLSKSFSVEIGPLIDQYIKESKIREEAGQRRQPNSFIIAPRKLSRKQGYDIEKIF
jgi:hypothetical protein